MSSYILFFFLARYQIFYSIAVWFLCNWQKNSRLAEALKHFLSAYFFNVNKMSELKIASSNIVLLIDLTHVKQYHQRWHCVQKNLRPDLCLYCRYQDQIPAQQMWTRQLDQVMFKNCSNILISKCDSKEWRNWDVIVIWHQFIH